MWSMLFKAKSLLFINGLLEYGINNVLVQMLGECEENIILVAIINTHATIEWSGALRSYDIG